MHEKTAASPWILRFLSLIREGGLVLDLACGTGRHAEVMAQQGLKVVAVDRDSAALDAFEAHEKHVTDLETGFWPLPDRRFDAIVVTNYLHRPLFPILLASLQPGGVLLYETFAAGNGAFGKPSNPAFLLAPGELLELVRGLRVVAFEDGYVSHPKPAMLQRICALRANGPDKPYRARL